MNNIPYILIECLSCGKESQLQQYHDSYNMMSKKLILTCPKCQYKMELVSFNIQELERA